MNTHTCPRHGTPLTGGPVLYGCDLDGGHVVRAADIDHEFQPQPAQAAATRHPIGR